VGYDFDAPPFIGFHMLDHITPVLLTFNEAENIGRTLSHLKWAKDIVVVDSNSTDETLHIIAKFPQVRVFTRPYDTHANKWRFAVEETSIATDWILRLDADYQVTDDLVNELARLDASAPVSAYRILFDYAIFSRRLLSSLYPANTILLRKGKFSVEDKGHTEAWTIQGRIETLNARVIHDDWKTTERWINDQSRNMSRELNPLRKKRAGLRAWLRLRPPLMPIAVFLYCLFGKGLILNGKAGVFYSLQRLVAEATLSLMVLEENLRDQTAARNPSAK
jgi:glycosyltransferase involved in cell wall biosynthesis